MRHYFSQGSSILELRIRPLPTPDFSTKTKPILYTRFEQSHGLGTRRQSRKQITGICSRQFWANPLFFLSPRVCSMAPWVVAAHSLPVYLPPPSAAADRSSNYCSQNAQVLRSLFPGGLVPYLTNINNTITTTKHTINITEPPNPSLC